MLILLYAFPGAFSQFSPGLLTDFPGGTHLHCHILVSRISFLPDRRHTLAFEADPGSGIGAFPDLAFHRSVQGRNCHFSTENHDRIGNPHCGIDIIAFPFKNRVLFNLNFQQKVSCFTPVPSRITLARQTDLASGSNTCRNMDLNRKKMDELMQYAQLNYVNELLRLGTMYHLLALITENASQDLPELPGENSDGQLYIKSAVNLLINSGKRNIRVEDVAHAIGISRSYFTSIFRREMKVSPQEFLMNFRMERARGLLRYTDRPVGEIAEEVGYADSMSFSKAFKKRFHMTPSEFRNSKMNFVSKTEKGEFTEGLL